MFYAKSMYQGGKVVSADDNDISYSSYMEYGICCLICNEDVFLRAGSEKRNHFADHKALSDSKCKLRVTANGYSKNWSSFNPEGKEQRRKLFQEYFVSIIKTQYKDFDTVKNIKEIVSPNTIINIHEKCIYSFYKNINNFLEECLSLSVLSYNPELTLQKIIASEAFQYLSSPPSKPLL